MVIYDIIFVLRDGSETRIPYDKTILIIDYFTLDGQGQRRRTQSLRFVVFVARLTF
jgi:hypothetical protein